MDYIRVLIDISCKFKKIGNFQVKEIVEGDDVKLIRLKGGPKFKIKSSEQFFERIKKEDVVEITRTATNRFVSFKIMTE